MYINDVLHNKAWGSIPQLGWLQKLQSQWSPMLHGIYGMENKSFVFPEHIKSEGIISEVCMENCHFILTKMHNTSAMKMWL